MYDDINYAGGLVLAIMLGAVVAFMVLAVAFA